MSRKNKDRENRFRSKTVAFRVSPEEWETLNRKVAMSGLKKQEFLIKSISNQDILIQGTPYVIRSLKKELKYFTKIFRDIRLFEDINLDDLEILELLLKIILAEKNDRLTKI